MIFKDVCLSLDNFFSMYDHRMQAFLPFFSEILKRYNVDLSNYAAASLERRINRFMNLYSLGTVDELERKLESDADFFEIFIREITVNTTEMFRDPSAWLTLRNEVLPLVADAPTIRIWHAGCSSGEEVYSMAVTLKEEGLYEKTRIVASDLNKSVISKARSGIYSLKSLSLNNENYLKAGGKQKLEDYYSVKEGVLHINESLKANISFLKHDLSSGQSFSRFDIILCRNVLIYFNKQLQERVFGVLCESLFKRGFIAIGKKESMSYFSNIHLFSVFNQAEKIYRLK